MVKNYFWYWDNVLSKEECARFLEGKSWEEKNALIGDSDPDGVIDYERRVTDVLFQDPYSVLGCVLQSYTVLANKNAGWGFSISHMEDIQLARYGVGGKYGWHKDYHFRDENHIRKLSSVILLNDPSEYIGGKLEIKDANLPELKCGSLIVFPSFLEHRVTEVLGGFRYTAVGWMCGPYFK